MELFPWKPIRLSLLDADRQIDDAFNQFIVSMCGGESSQAIWSPQIDVYEADDAYVIEADLPGVSQDQLHVQVADTVVTISGTRATTQHGQSARGVWIERQHGSFSRSLKLEHPVDPDQVSVAQSQGTYSIRLPKRKTNGTSAHETAGEASA
ncbi:MAG: Hsp20/alpha crystallin family protein [Maioricimonas sp. JB045]|uniref:Hsp20/alpha crystallin family protein n=1 Tax=Maioricimonas sp. JC845 TaxID=3232138 RepID=UPI00345ACB93